MVDGGHAEDAFAAAFEADDLDDDAHGLHDEDAADDDQDDFLFAADGEGGDAAADGEGAGVTHEHFGGVGVEPEEAEAGTGEGHRDDGEFGGVGDVGDVQVGGVAGVATDVTEAGVGEGGGEGAAGGEAVEAVGEVHGVGGADDDDGEEGNGEDAHVGDDGVFEERDMEFAEDGGVVSEVREEDAGDEGDAALPSEFEAGGDAFGILFADLEVVVVEAEEAEADGGEEDGPDEDVIPFGPEESGDDDGGEDENAAHGGGAGFFAVEFEEFVDLFSGADGLADFEGDQFADEAVAKQQGEDKGGESRAACAEGVVFEDVEDLVEQPFLGREQLAVFVEPIDHAETGWKWVRIFSMAEERLPLSRTRSPGRRSSRRWAAQEVWSVKWAMVVEAAERAASVMRAASEDPTVKRPSRPREAANSPT